jgi:N,N'-diacetyllegionaminate synthase
MEAAFNTPVGYSDHTQGVEVAIAAVSMGACVIEKHFTLDRNMPGPDHRASLEPDELATMIQNIRTIESAMGNGRKIPADSETNTAEVARKSLVAAQFLAAGTVLTEELIATKRPGTGLPPAMRDEIIGRTVKEDIQDDQPFSLENLS